MKKIIVISFIIINSIILIWCNTQIKDNNISDIEPVPSLPNISNKVDFNINENYYDNLTYKNVINYIELNITEIINDFSEKKPANSKWFADWYGFTSNSDVYVDFEDGHFLYRALLKCNNEQNIISCNAIAIFEKDKDWKVIQWVDTVKDDAIIYKWAKDYEWKR